MQALYQEGQGTSSGALAESVPDNVDVGHRGARLDGGGFCEGPTLKRAAQTSGGSVKPWAGGDLRVGRLE